MRTKDWSTAKLLACQYHLAMSNEFNIRKLDIVFPGGFEARDIQSDDDLTRLRKILKLPEIADYLKLAAQSRATPPTPSRGLTEEGVATIVGSATRKTKPFSETALLYLQEKHFDNSIKTIQEKESVFNDFARIFNNPDTNSITKEQAISYKTSLIGKNFSELRINKVLGFLRDLFGYAINHNLYLFANPFEKLNISRKARLKAKVNSYQQFSDDDLKLIFENGEYQKFLNKPNYKWLPFLALFTGARLEELASLNLSQIKKEDGILFFDIIKAKNSNSVRRIPLHDAIINSEFSAYVESVRNKGGQLFPELNDGKNGFSKNMSRRFGLYLDSINLMESRKVFHSFRSTFINRLTEKSVHPAIIMALVGHYEQANLDFSSPHFHSYQQPKKLVVLKESIDKLTYPLELKF